MLSLFFFFNDTATTEIYPLSLHDALPICPGSQPGELAVLWPQPIWKGDRADLVARHRRVDTHHVLGDLRLHLDRKSTRLNSSHLGISYAVFCLKKKKNICARQLIDSCARS